jgi:hypothetical protein
MSIDDESPKAWELRRESEMISRRCRMRILDELKDELPKNSTRISLLVDDLVDREICKIFGVSKRGTLGGLS